MRPFSEQDLISYQLGELSSRRARALERALRTDPSLAAEAAAFAATLGAFKNDAPALVDEEMLSRQWGALRPSLEAYRARPVLHSRWRIPVVAGAGLVFAATALLVATHHHSSAAPVPTLTDRQETPATLSTVPEDSAAAGPVRSKDHGATPRRRAAEETVRVSLSTQSLPEQGDRTLASLPLAYAPAAIPRPIPLASVDLSTAPMPPPPLVVLEPVDSAPAVTLSSRPRGKHEHASAHHAYPSDLMFAMGGTLIGSRSPSDSAAGLYAVGATHAVSALAAYHQQLRTAVGYRVTLSYTRPDFHYEYRGASGSLGEKEIDGRVYELAATYVVQGPHRGNLSTSIEAGAGLMGFVPSQQSAETSHNLRAAAVTGVAADYALTKRLGLHLGYRVQAFKAPDFDYSGYAKPVVSNTLISSEPLVGITYRFHAK